jgi:glucans biosynthesis protein
VFADENPRGFGLLQRTRDFAAYQDLEARYELRPSLWVEPQGSWGAGDVRLIELPTDLEVHDNMVAFWAPKPPVEPGVPWELAYRLHWCKETPFAPDVARTTATRVGVGGPPVPDADPAVRKFVVDFEGGQLAALPADLPVEPVAWVSGGELGKPVAQKNPVTHGWRAFFDLRPAAEGPTELRCFLKLGDNVLTETWIYQWTA